jgi:predicted Zn-dependent protease with MMP-like domain
MRVFHHYQADESGPERVTVRETDRSAVQEAADAFQALVTAALDELPAQFLKPLDEVPVVISDDGWRFGAYGLYVGATIANPGYAAQIFIYRDTLTRDFGHDPILLADQVRRVVRHELGHHLGFDEQGVADLGL